MDKRYHLLFIRKLMVTLEKSLNKLKTIRARVFLIYF